MYKQERLRKMKIGKRFLAQVLSLCLLMGLFVSSFAFSPAVAADPPPRVGAYYFPGWMNAEDWTSIKYFDQGTITPIAGNYRSGVPETLEFHTKQALQHNIDFWTFDLYYDITKDAVYGNSNAVIDNGFLKAASNKKMDFSVMWCNEEASFSSSSGYSKAQLLQMVKTFGKRYFSQSNYLRTPDGRCVFSMTLPERLISTYGAAGTKALLAEMSAAASAWGGLYFMGIKAPVASEMTKMKNAGFDAITLYSYNETNGMDSIPYSSVISTYDPMWKTAKQSGTIGLIPMVSPNWDSRPWAGLGDRGTYLTGSTPELFGQMCTKFKEHVDPALNMMMIGTWNEFGEGSHIEPTVEKGCTYLDAMQKAIFPDKFKTHAILKPTAAEAAAMQFKDIPPKAGSMKDTENQLINPSFEQDYGWVTFNETPMKYATNPVKDGARSLTLGKDQNGVKSTTLVTIKPGKKYLVSVWVYGKAELVSALYDDGVWLGTYAEHAAGGETGKWTKLEAVYDPGDKKSEFYDPDAESFDVEIVNAEESKPIYVDLASVTVWQPQDSSGGSGSNGSGSNGSGSGGSGGGSGGGGGGAETIDPETGKPISANLLPNPDFEEDGGWETQAGEFTITKRGEPVYDGKRSFRLSKDDKGMKSTEKIAFVSGAAYDVSFWIYGKAKLVLGLYAPDGKFVEYQETDLAGGKQGEWVEIVERLTLAKRSDIGFFDVQFLNEEEDYPNMLANPDMEGPEKTFVAFDEGELNWNTSIAHSGKKSFQVTPEQAGAKYSPPFGVEYGQSYGVSAWVYGRVSILAAQFGADGEVIDYFGSITNGGVEGEWTLLSGVFKIENPNIKTLNIEFRPAGKPVNVDDVKLTIANTIFIDNVSLSVAQPKAPKAPVNLTAKPGDKSCKLSWEAPADNGKPITGYVISYKTNEGTSEPISIGAGETSYKLTGLTPETAYNLTLVAVNEIGEGEGAYVIFLTEAKSAVSGQTLTWLFILIAVLVVAGAGVGVFFFLRSRKKPSEAIPESSPETAPEAAPETKEGQEENP